MNYDNYQNYQTLGFYDNIQAEGGDEDMGNETLPIVNERSVEQAGPAVSIIDMENLIKRKVENLTVSPGVLGQIAINQSNQEKKSRIRNK